MHYLFIKYYLLLNRIQKLGSPKAYKLGQRQMILLFTRGTPDNDSYKILARISLIISNILCLLYVYSSMPTNFSSPIHAETDFSKTVKSCSLHPKTLKSIKKKRKS